MSRELLTRRERRERQAIRIETEGREMLSPCTACWEAKSRTEDLVLDVWWTSSLVAVRSAYGKDTAAVTYL